MTEPLKSGEGSSSHAEGFDRVMDKADARMGLKDFSSGGVEAEKLLSLSQDALRGMSADDCGEAAVALAQYSFYLQRALNREEARVNYLAELVKRKVAALLPYQKAPSVEERRMLAVQSNPEADEIDRQRIKHEGLARRLAYLAQRVEYVARTFLALQETKRKHHA